MKKSLLKCDPYINVYLFTTQLLVAVFVDFLEDIGSCWRIANIDELNLEHESRLRGNDIASTAIAIAQFWRNDQFAFFT